MKTFKKILSEVAQPKSSEEKAFKDLHNQKPGQHPVAPDNQFTGDIGKAKASRPADQEDDSNYDQAYGNKPSQEPVLRAGRKFSQFRANESKDMTNAKALDKASSASAEGKKKVSLAKAPWEKSNKNESISEAELDEAIDNMSDETLANFIEEIEQLDELSPELLKRYRGTAKGDITSRDAKTKLKVARGAWDDGDVHPRQAYGHTRANNQKNMERQAFRQLAKGKIQKKDAKDGHKSAKHISHEIERNPRDPNYGNTGPKKRAVPSYSKMKGDKSSKKHPMPDDDRHYEAAGYEAKETLSDIAFGKWNEALKGGQKKLDHNKNGKIDGHDFAIMRARKKSNEEVDVVETTSSAMRHMVTQTGPDGKTRTVMKKLRSDRTDDRGQDVIRTNEASMDNMCCKDCGDMFGKPTKGNACKNDCNDPNQSCWVNKESYNEEVINELDKKTLSSYIKKAHNDSELQRQLGQHHRDYAMAAGQTKDGQKHAGLMHKHKKRVVNRSMGIKKAVNRLVGESFTEMLDEAVKMGNLRLKNGKNVKVSNQDAKLLNSFYKNLNAKNRRDMEKVMMKDESGFKEIVGFAREAL